MEPVSAVVLAEREKSRQRSNEISHLMGQYLLKGWRMLSNSCPVCGTILLLNKNEGIYCVACREVDNLNKSESESVASGESVPDNACGDTFQQSPDSSDYLNHRSLPNVSVTVSAGARPEIDRKRKRSDNVSELMGHYLLKGWQMLDDHCPICNTELLRNKESTCCVACNKVFSEPILTGVPTQKNGNYLLDSLSLPSLKGSPLAENFAEREKLRRRSDKISELMGLYLLKGWRMLESYCPVCDTILFLNKEGSFYCVACNEIDNQAKPENSGAGGISPSRSNNQQLPPDSSRPLNAEQPIVELGHVESALRNAIIESSHRLLGTSNPKEIEQLANSIKSLSDALFNVRKCLSM